MTDEFRRTIVELLGRVLLGGSEELVASVNCWSSYQFTGQTVQFEFIENEEQPDGPTGLC